MGPRDDLARATAEDSAPVAPATEPGRIARAFYNFDLLDKIGVGIARYAGVNLPRRAVNHPRINLSMLKAAAGAVIRDRSKRIVFLVFLAALGAFSVVVGVLVVSGTLGDVYESVWRRYPGEPWTHAMRKKALALWIAGCRAGF